MEGSKIQGALGWFPTTQIRQVSKMFGKQYMYYFPQSIITRQIQIYNILNHTESHVFPHEGIAVTVPWSSIHFLALAQALFSPPSGPSPSIRIQM